MPKTIVQDSDATGVIQYGGAGTWAASGYIAAASGNGYHFNTTSGAACGVNILAGSSFTGLCFTTIATYAPLTVSVQLDTQPAVLWTIWNGGDTDGNAPNEYQTTFGATLIPQDGLAHSVVATLIGNPLGGQFCIDTVELYTAESYVVGRMGVVGNSIGQGYGTTIETLDGLNPTGVIYPNGCMAGTARRLGLDLGGAHYLYNVAFNGMEIHCATPAVDPTKYIGWQWIMAGKGGVNYWDDFLPQLAYIMFGYNGCRSQDPQRWGSTTALINSALSYHATMYTRRVADLLTRMYLRSPHTTVVVCGMPYASTTYASYGWLQSGTFSYPGDFNKGWPDGTTQPTTPRNNGGLWDDSVRALCSNRSLYPNAVFCATQQSLYGAGPYVSGTNPGTLLDATHPTDYGAGILADKLAAVGRTAHGGGSGRRGGAY